MDSISTGITPSVSLSDAATLVALTLKRTTNKAGQPRTRVRMSDKTFRRLTGRRVRGARVVREFSEQLMNLGWLMVRMPSAYGFLRAAAVAKWPLTKSNVVAEELKLIGSGSLSAALDNAQQELGGSDDLDSPSHDAGDVPPKKVEKEKRLAKNG